MPAFPAAGGSDRDAAVAALTEDDIPPADDLHGWPDPDCGRPAELAALSGEELDELLATTPAQRFRRAEPSWPVPVRVEQTPPAATRLDQARPTTPGPGEIRPMDPGLEQTWPAAARLGEPTADGGCGFAGGGTLDVLTAGLPLAGFAEDAHAALTEITDDELIGLTAAWRRLSSWASARELAAVAELARRRPAEGTPAAPPGGGLPDRLSEFIPDEVAAALTLTRGAAQAETELAVDLADGLRATHAALAAGLIDLPKAKILADGTRSLTAAHAAAVEAAVLPEAPAMTAGQLRRAVATAILAADPCAAREQREEAVKHARVDCYPDPVGTASLSGHNLPAADVMAADRQLSRIATAWQKLGAAGGMDLLRAWAYLTLLLGHSTDAPPAHLLPADPPVSPDGGPDGSGAGPAGPQAPAGLRRPGRVDGLPPLAGSVNLTIPLTTLMGRSDAPGAAAGFGPLDPDTARALACAAAGHRSTRWHITVVGPAGRALGYGSARGARTPGQATTAGASTGNPGGPGDQWTVTVTAEPIAAGGCDHRNRESRYRPSPALQRLVRDRSSTCSYYGCGRPARQCDLDHTTPHDQGGLTCECNLAPLCRHHHRMKQTEGWTLQQVSPGVMAWLTPAGRRYIILPSQHPT